jgi:hypothetical protein
MSTTPVDDPVLTGLDESDDEMADSVHGLVALDDDDDDDCSDQVTLVIGPADDPTKQGRFTASRRSIMGISKCIYCALDGAKDSDDVKEVPFVQVDPEQFRQYIWPYINFCGANNGPIKVELAKPIIDVDIKHVGLKKHMDSMDVRQLFEAMSIASYFDIQPFTLLCGALIASRMKKMQPDEIRDKFLSQNAKEEIKRREAKTADQDDDRDISTSSNTKRKSSSSSSSSSSSRARKRSHQEMVPSTENDDNDDEDEHDDETMGPFFSTLK